MHVEYVGISGERDWRLTTLGIYVVCKRARVALKMIGWAANMKESDSLEQQYIITTFNSASQSNQVNLYLCEAARTMIPRVMTGSRLFQGTQAHPGIRSRCDLPASVYAICDPPSFCDSAKRKETSRLSSSRRSALDVLPGCRRPACQAKRGQLVSAMRAG